VRKRKIVSGTSDVEMEVGGKASRKDRGRTEEERKRSSPRRNASSTTPELALFSARPGQHRLPPRLEEVDALVGSGVAFLNFPPRSPAGASSRSPSRPASKGCRSPDRETCLLALELVVDTAERRGEGDIACGLREMRREGVRTVREMLLAKGSC
jgi:hypothetical protein